MVEKDSSRFNGKKKNHMIAFLAILLPLNFDLDFATWLIPSAVEISIFMVYLTKCKQHHYYQPIILALGMGIGVGFLMDTIAFRVIRKVGIFPGGDGSIIPAGIFSLAVSIIISLLIIKVLDTLSTIGDD